MEKKYMGIDVGGTDIKAGVVDAEGKVFFEKKIPTQVSMGVEHVFSRIVDLVDELCVCLIEGDEIAGVGLGMPGQIDAETGILRYAPNLPGFKNIDGISLLKDRLDIPVVWENDANAAALGEFIYGAGRGVSEMMMITLGTGIGSGLILGGKIYHGANGFAGEFGHLTVDPEGPECGCGSRGCAEAYAGTKGIINILKEKLNSGCGSLLDSMDISTITPRDITLAARKGDTTAREVLAQAGKYLGIGFASVINLLNLEKIVVGGGVSKAGDLIFDSAKVYLKMYSLADTEKEVSIVSAELGNKAGLIGAAYLAKLESE